MAIREPRFPSKRQPEFPPKDLPLREDVGRVGRLVGEVIREQGGSFLFDRVEGARTWAIARREGEAEAEARLGAVLAVPSTAEAAELVRAFSTYFQVVNIAERVHRIRRRRDYARQAVEAPQLQSLSDTVNRLRQGGLDAGTVRRLLDDLSVELVFTAHPSEATRRTILDKHRRIARHLLERVDRVLTPAEEERLTAAVRTEVTAGWQTEEHPRERPTVDDELDHVLFHFSDAIYRVIPYFYEDLGAALEAAYGPEALEVPTVIRFASWVGGDMDGNPNVDARTFRRSLARHRQVIIGLYRDEIAGLYNSLSQSTSRVAVDARLEEKLHQYVSEFPGHARRQPQRYRDMPYRTFLRMIDARLGATLDGSPGGYTGAEAFVEDLKLISGSLLANRGRRAGWTEVRRLIRRAQTFGFHLATLDARQNAGVHREILASGLGVRDWPAMSAEERIRHLRQALESDSPPQALTAKSRRTLEVFRAMEECRQRYGPRSAGPYIVSMTEDVDDLLSVLLLARWSGIAGGGRAAALDVIPLFETGRDLERAAAVVSRLLGEPAYRSHLAARGDRQVVMVGYSDSNKDSGLVRSRWMIHRAQHDLAAAVAGTGVELTVFHGRGGTAGRGGGKTYRGILASPSGAVRGRLRVTEQGETINEKYSLDGIAMRNLEQAVGATALATIQAVPDETPDGTWSDLMDRIAAASHAAYRQLKDAPGFLDYFLDATPIDVIERMAIASRPARRRGRKRGIEDLRAIPWVFAWTQSRHLIPGWFGLGSGLRAAVDAFGEEAVAAAVGAWTFLRTVIDDAEMTLAKADMPIALRYAGLAGDRLAHVFDRIHAEYDLTVEMILGLKGTTALLDEDPALQRSIRLRNPYVDPMSFIQVDLLRHWRRSGRPDDDVFRALLATVSGIAQGLQNTG